MKKTALRKISTLYKFWSAALLAFFVFSEEFRKQAFLTWVVITVVLSIAIIVITCYSLRKKRKATEQTIKKIISERNNKLARKASKLGKKEV